RVGTVRMAESGDVDDIGVPRIDLNAPDLLAVAEPDEVPGLARVARAVHAATLSDVRAHVGLARADVDHARIRSSDREGGDRADGHVIEDGLPRAARVEALPNSSVHGSEIEVVGLVANSRSRQHAASTERSDEPPIKLLKQSRLHRTRESVGCDQQEQSGKE